MHTPVANAGLTYATVRYKGKPIAVHRLVWMTFMGDIPEGMTIDHLISNRKFDNRLSALRLATMEHAEHQPRPQTDFRARQFAEEWQSAAGQQTAATTRGKRSSRKVTAERVLHARFPEKKFYQAGIGVSARAASEGKKAVRYGWVFEYV